MSGEDIPYQLRPNKFIDRQMFIEMLSRLLAPRGPEKYIYVSMGGRHLVDHSAVYNELGINALFSFDQNKNEVKRQQFNRPIGKTICVELNTADVPLRIDEILNRFRSKRNLIIWFDYTDTNRRSQFQEAVQTMSRLKHGDVFRITFNASPNSLSVGDDWKKAEVASPGIYRANNLRAQIEEYMPTDIDSIAENELPTVLARCMELASMAAQGLANSLRITPTLVTSYKDGTRMLTITCAINDERTAECFPSPAFSRWQFAARGWTDIKDIYAPVLSTREQNALNANLHRGVNRMLAALKFLPSENKAKSLKALTSYRTFHRYYPSFRNVED